MVERHLRQQPFSSVWWVRWVTRRMNLTRWWWSFASLSPCYVRRCFAWVVVALTEACPWLPQMDELISPDMSATLFCFFFAGVIASPPFISLWLLCQYSKHCKGTPTNRSHHLHCLWIDDLFHGHTQESRRVGSFCFQADQNVLGRSPGACSPGKILEKWSQILQFYAFWQ